MVAEGWRVSGSEWLTGKLKASAAEHMISSRAYLEQERIS